MQTVRLFYPSLSVRSVFVIEDVSVFLTSPTNTTRVPNRQTPFSHLFYLSLGRRPGALRTPGATLQRKDRSGTSSTLPISTLS